jgi:pimeloyl-ACP methyl ester carboxylesterase
MPPLRPAVFALLLCAVLAPACGGDGSSSPGTHTPRPLPAPVDYRQEPQGVTLGDPSFEALPGATADFGQLGGAVYQIEMPDNWNGRLLLFMHGYGELAPEARASAPGIRTWLILHGYAWGASSFSSTSSIPGRSADETAALWDFFARKYGRPQWTYVTGVSMGGAASHIASERYPDRFDGALALCGSAGQTPGIEQQTDFFSSAAYVAGVTQQEFDAATDIPQLVADRIMPALQDPAKHEEWESIMIDLSGGPRAYDREGFHFEEETNWERSQLVVASGLATNVGTDYRLGPVSDIPSDAYNRDVIRIPLNDSAARVFTEGEDTTGNIQMPLISLHTTGDAQVFISQAQIYQRSVDAAGRSDLLVQRVFRDPGHCGFTNAEWAANLEALVEWVERDVKPAGEDVLIDDLRAFTGEYEISPRDGRPEAEAVPGAQDRVVVRGTLTLDGEPFSARFLGAVVRTNGLVSPCQFTIPTIEDGAYEIKVYADTEIAGCGREGSEIVLWTFTDEQFFTTNAAPWPGNGETVTFDGTFSTSAPDGGSPKMTQFSGEAFASDGEYLPGGTRVEAYVGDVLCGVGALRRTGSFTGFILDVVGPDDVAGCDKDATLTFRVDGKPAGPDAIHTLGEGGGNRGRGRDLIQE